MEGLDDNLLTFLQHLREFGLVYLRKRSSGRFYPTNLAINITAGNNKVSLQFSIILRFIYLIILINVKNLFTFKTQFF